jgi:hypothetical protein
MKARCYNPNYFEKRYYGERGIEICEEWLNSFDAFRKWSLENGYADNLTIDRIDVNKGYSPDNCRWITQKEQNRNKRNNIYIEHDGEIKTLVDWCAELNLKYGTIEMRIKRGWDKGKALVTPVKSIKQGKGVWRKVNTDYFCY